MSTDAPAMIACDLDRTMIYSRRAFSLPAGVAEPAVVCAEIYDGAEFSFLTAVAADGLAELSQRCTFVPTTTRTVAQLERITLPLAGAAPRYAIAANGGVLLLDGTRDATWSASVRSSLERDCAPLEEAWKHMQSVFVPAFTLNARVAEDLFCFAVVAVHLLPKGLLAELTAWAQPRGWRVSMQGRKIYLVPSVLTKQAAALEVARRIGADTYLAAGDSLLDIDLLEGASAGIRPAHGELEDTNWSAPHIERTAARGLLAGQEIVTWFRAQLH